MEDAGADGAAHVAPLLRLHPRARPLLSLTAAARNDRGGGGGEEADRGLMERGIVRGGVSTMHGVGDGHRGAQQRQRGLRPIHAEFWQAGSDRTRRDHRLSTRTSGEGRQDVGWPRGQMSSRERGGEWQVVEEDRRRGAADGRTTSKGLLMSRRRARVEQGLPMGGWIGRW
ncbi:hypothetical protein ABZP36_033305 [Zizania latifolia]